MPFQDLGLSPERRFQYKVWQHGDCWEWRGSRNENGYGLFTLWAGKVSTTLKAHRFAYIMAKGDIPPGYEIDHICRHPWCVRPSHLEAVTPEENWKRSWNSVKRFCKRGHPLTPENTYVGNPTYRNTFRLCRACRKLRES